MAIAPRKVWQRNSLYIEAEGHDAPLFVGLFRKLTRRPRYRVKPAFGDFSTWGSEENARAQLERHADDIISGFNL